MTVQADATRQKDPSRVARGIKGMRARWGPEPRVIRLDDLTDAQRRLVVALVNAARKEAAPIVNETSIVTAMEAQRAAADNSST